jgi:hypothetical protein
LLWHRQNLGNVGYFAATLIGTGALGSTSAGGGADGWRVDNALAKYGASGAYVDDAGGTLHAWRVATSRQRDYFVQVTGDGAAIAPICRRVDSLIDQRCYKAYRRFANIYIIRSDSGGADNTIDTVAAVGPPVTLKLEVSGPIGNVRVRTWADGSLVSDVTDTTNDATCPPVNGHPGFEADFQVVASAFSTNGGP